MGKHKCCKCGIVEEWSDMCGLSNICGFDQLLFCEGCYNKIEKLVEDFIHAEEIEFDIEFSEIKIPSEMFKAIKTIITEKKKLGFEYPEEFIREGLRSAIVLYGSPEVHQLVKGGGEATT